jgi:hypothetical protein
MKAFIENHSHAKYLLCNSFQTIEPDFQKVTAWIKGDVIVKLIGPLHLYTQHTLNDETISNFLTDKPEKSVIFISLGSTGKLTPEQTREFYHALIESKKPFVKILIFTNTKFFRYGHAKTSPTSQMNLQYKLKAYYYPGLHKPVSYPIHQSPVSFLIVVGIVYWNPYLSAFR